MALGRRLDDDDERSTALLARERAAGNVSRGYDPQQPSVSLVCRCYATPILSALHLFPYVCLAPPVVTYPHETARSVRKPPSQNRL